MAGCVEALITGNCDLMLAYSSAKALPTLADIDYYPSAPLARDRLVAVVRQGRGGAARYSSRQG